MTRKVTNITVAIPTLDRPSELTRCLDGLFMGTTLPAEVLIINQGKFHLVESAMQQSVLSVDLDIHRQLLIGQWHHGSNAGTTIQA